MATMFETFIQTNSTKQNPFGSLNLNDQGEGISAWLLSSIAISIIFLTTIHNAQVVICNFQFAIYNSKIAIYTLQIAIYNLQIAIGYSLFAKDTYSSPPLPTPP